MAGDTIVILGGYRNTGRLLARLLLAHTPCHLVLAGRHPERAAALVETLNGETGEQRVQAHAVEPQRLLADMVRLGAGVEVTRE